MNSTHIRLTDRNFDLIRLGLGVDGAKPKPFTPADWAALYEIAQEQAMVGVAFAGVMRLEPGEYPDKVLRRLWLAEAEQIRRRNEQLNRVCVELTCLLEDAGLDSCILKGQGIAALYPDPLSRQPGDIDVWVRPRDKKQREGTLAAVREIRECLKKMPFGQVGRTLYHHTEWHLEDVEVEVHHRPLQLNNPVANRRLQKWCLRHWDARTKCNGFYVPSADFNAVYLLAHLYHHILFEGVGLRQVCDYFILLSRSEVHCDTSILKRLNMMRFARGMMWVLGEVFHLERAKMIVEPDEQEGRFLLSEIMRSGNFGHSLHEPNHRPHSMWGRFLYRTKYRARFLFRYPSEILWDILFRLYHSVWRLHFNYGANLTMR